MDVLIQRTFKSSDGRVFTTLDEAADHDVMNIFNRLESKMNTERFEEDLPELRSFTKKFLVDHWKSLLSDLLDINCEKIRIQELLDKEAHT